MALAVELALAAELDLAVELAFAVELARKSEASEVFPEVIPPEAAVLFYYLIYGPPSLSPLRVQFWLHRKIDQ